MLGTLVFILVGNIFRTLDQYLFESLQWIHKHPGKIYEFLQWNYKPLGKISQSLQ